MRFLEHPVIVYIIVSVVSISAAIILFLVGDSLAEVTGQENTLAGVSFRASGALGGFILIFLLSVRVLERLRRAVPTGQINFKLYLTSNDEAIVRHGSYICKYWLFNEGSGDSTEYATDHRWEAGVLTIDVRNVGPDDWIQVQVEDTDNSRVWTADYFHSRAHRVQVHLGES